MYFSPYTFKQIADIMPEPGTRSSKARRPASLALLAWLLPRSA